MERHLKSYYLVEGAIFVILGILAIIAPFTFTVAFELMIGWLFVVGGIVQAYRIFTRKNSSGLAFSIFSSILYLVVGFLLLFYPFTGILTITFMLAAFYFLEGIAQISYATFLKDSPNWGWLLLSGIIAIIVAFIIWSGWPGTAYWVLGILVGINLIFYGFSKIFLASLINTR